MHLKGKKILKAAITAVGGYTPKTILSNEKLESYGWKPIYTIDDGIKELKKAYSMVITDNNKKYTNL